MPGFSAALQVAQRTPAAGPAPFLFRCAAPFLTPFFLVSVAAADPESFLASSAFLPLALLQQTRGVREKRAASASHLNIGLTRSAQVPHSHRCEGLTSAPFPVGVSKKTAQKQRGLLTSSNVSESSLIGVVQETPPD